MIPPYHRCQGSWRPDFLLEGNDEHYRVCEINARFPFNLFLHAAFCQQAYIDVDDKIDPLALPVAHPKEASDGSPSDENIRTYLQQICDSLLGFFDHSLPLHLLKGEETGLDIHQFVLLVQSVTGRKPSLIEPSNLRLVTDHLSSTGFALTCVAGIDPEGHEVFERVHQVGLELCQHELRALSVPMLREIALCCFNDLRTIFLVHDKRMLGIVLSELDDLVEKQKILTTLQAERLRILAHTNDLPKLETRDIRSFALANDILARNAIDLQHTSDWSRLQPIAKNDSNRSPSEPSQFCSNKKHSGFG